MCSTLIISFSSCVFKHIKKICDLKKDFSEDEKSYSIFPAGAFAKNLFIFHFFKVTFGGISAAELLFFVACRRQRFSHARRVRIIKLLQLFPIGLYGFAVVFVSERSVRKIGSDFRPHRLPVGEKFRTRKTAFPTFCEQPCACCGATISRGVFNPSCGCFRKKSFYLSLFKVTFGGISAAELLSPVACAPKYYFSSLFAVKDFLTLAAFG